MKVTSLMREYLTESTQDEIQRALFGKLDSKFPIEVEKKPEWQTLEDPPRLKRKFRFKNPKQVIQFIFEVIQYEIDAEHNGSILIEGNNVTAEVYTHAVDDITELDIEYAEELSNIYVDVNDYEKDTEATR